MNGHFKNILLDGGIMKKLPIVLLSMLSIPVPCQQLLAETLVTADGKSIDITYYHPPSEGAPVVVLIPGTPCDRSAFQSLPAQLQKAGFAAVAMDMRYKALIRTVERRGREEMIKTLKSQDLYAPVKYDVKAVLDYIAEKKEIDQTRVVLLGGSYGSRVAIHAGVEYGVAALVLVSLSSEEALPGKSVRELLEQYAAKPVLLMTSEKDWGNNFTAAADNRRYAAWGVGKRDLKIWTGSAHGPDIAERKEGAAFVIEWLKGNL
jgi:pimeloyl-ACP methyl ester carboxylesterase